jgi:hypothetical protein
MRGLVPRIHVFRKNKTWMAQTSGLPEVCT